jgi:2-aminoadipate transaminase
MTSYDQFLSRAASGMQESAIRKMGTVLAGARDIISFAPGYPAPETFAWDDFRAISAELLDGRDGSVLQYGPTRGFKPLLGAVVEMMAARGIQAALEHLLVTTGSQQGLDLVARVLLDPGDVALVELPAYTGAITAFRNVQAELVGVRQEPDGIDLADLDAVLARLRSAGRRVRFLYVVPNFQNPTGLLLALEKRRALLDWASRQNLIIVEDDPYRDIYFGDSSDEGALRPLKADDREGRVIYLSSFSKTLAPGFRTAWMVAPPPLASRRQFPILPFRNRRPGLEWHMRDKCDRISLLQLLIRTRESFFHRPLVTAPGTPTTISSTRGRILLQVLKELRIRNLRFGRPFRLDRFDRTRR